MSYTILPVKMELHPPSWMRKQVLLGILHTSAWKKGQLSRLHRTEYPKIQSYDISYDSGMWGCPSKYYSFLFCKKQLILERPQTWMVDYSYMLSWKDTHSCGSRRK